MRKLVLLVRRLKRITLFKISIRILIVILMFVGAWVATRTFDSPEVVEFNDKVKHFIVFFGFSLLMDLAITRGPFWQWKGLPLLIYGAIIEIMQYFSLERSFSFFDWLADFLGILLYLLIKLTISRGEVMYSINYKR